MRRLVPVVPALALITGLVGCEKKPSTTGAEPTATATAAATATAPAVADAAAEASEATAAHDAGAKHHRDMGNCPTAVSGATVAIKDAPGGVELAITSKDPAATAEIRARTKKLVEADRNEAEAGVKHTGTGEGGGRYGRCTVVMRNTKLETAEIEGGVKATVKAKDASEVDWLRRETRDRDRDAKQPGAEGAGAQRMANCPSAVTGAKTVVKDTKDGVLVTVTGSGDAVKEIRHRAEHAARTAKAPPQVKAEHTGEGAGGGGLGRCPVVVEGDTTVEVKEIPNGAEIAVKSTKDVPALQKEAKARAANLQ